MKILSAEQQKKWDQFTIAHEPINSLELMERASKRWLENARPFIKDSSIWFLIGAGNNGGDGLAIARMLNEEGYDVQVLLFRFNKTLSTDCHQNLKRLPNSIALTAIDSLSQVQNIKLPPTATVVDALFGTGLSSGLRSPFVEVINIINGWCAHMLSIDLPSGLNSDGYNDAEDAIIRSTQTFTFQAPKLAFFLPGYKKSTGNWKTVDIGLHHQYLEAVQTDYHLLNEESIAGLLQKRGPLSHKGDFGHLITIAGTSRTFGASILTSKAGLKSGCGWASILVDDLDKSREINKTYPELMIAEPDVLNSLTDKHYLCIGSGLGTDNESLKKLRNVINSANRSLVIDADALNLIAAHRELLHQIPAQTILTPHPGELSKLIGTFKNDIAQLEAARAFAVENHIVLLIKRSNTAIIDIDGTTYFNTTGNPGLAKAGSGDVLTGMIASFLAQGMQPKDAACVGVYLHGKAADLAVEDESTYGLTPEILINYVGKAILNTAVV